MSVTISGTAGVTFNDASNQTTAATGFGFKNRLINGGMTVDQRGSASAPVTLNGNLFGVDRWGTQASQNSKATMQQSTTATTGFSNSLLVTSSSAYSPISSDYFWLYQTIEGFNIADLGWGSASAQTITLSFWVRASVTGTYSVRVGNGARSYVSTYTVNSANTFEYKTITIAGDTSGTWNTTNGAGIQLQYDLGCGSTRTTSTTNAWQAGDFQKATGSVSLVETNTATLYITGVQLEKGSTATSFDYRPYGTELALCQRYYQQYDASENGASGAGLVGVCGATNTGVMSGLLPVAMRTTATVAFNNLVLNYGAATVGVSSITVYSAQKAIGMDITTSTSPMTVGRACVLQFTGGASSANKITYSAEL
jgi:hypothetical protein